MELNCAAERCPANGSSNPNETFRRVATMLGVSRATASALLMGLSLHGCWIECGPEVDSNGNTV